MRTWPQRFPERLTYELDRFAERDLDFQLDEDLLKTQGRVVLRGSIEYQAQVVGVDVIYPDLFPFLRPEVIAKELHLGRHQNPFEGNLCLLDRSTRAWKPSYTGAWLVAEKLPYLLELLEADEEAMRQAEAPQGEPASHYFRTATGAVVFVPAPMLELPLEARAGSGRIAFAPFEPPQVRIRGMISQLVEKRGNRKTRTLATADQELLARFNGREIPFRWVRLEGLPPENRPISLIAAVDSAQPGFGSPPRENVAGGAVGICAGVFREEVRQGEFEDSWLFAVQYEGNGEACRYAFRGERFSRADLEARLPEYVHLGEKRIALAGLGALGGELALDLARAGLGELRGLDADSVEGGTISRWVGGLTAVAHPKTEYLRERFLYDYPYTKFESFPMHIGGSATVLEARDETELDQLERFLDGADLLIDATAEIGVQQALGAAAGERGLTQLYISATEGARGGLIARIVPNSSGGCWMCLQLAIEEGTIPIPAHAEPLTLQPRGCSSLTYRGAAFDLAPISAQASRCVAATLAEDADPGGSLAFVCSLEERLAPPTWSTHPIERHPACPLCAENAR